jgi:nitrile hydratase accessory protein
MSTASCPVDLTALPAIPRDAEGPVFRAPWEAQAFALAIELHRAGRYSWQEWTEALSAEIKAAQAAGDADLGDTYYRHWLAALEKLVTTKGLVGADRLARRRAAWAEAAARTPHGKPIELPPEERRAP